MPVSTDDYVAVADHIGRYCWKVDSGDGDGWAALWTEDGVFAVVSAEPVTGRAALREMPLSIRTRFGDALCHKAMNIFCDYAGDNDTIHAHFYNDVTTWMTGEPGKPYAMARCRMTLVRAGSGWLVRRNDVSLLTGQ